MTGFTKESTRASTGGNDEAPAKPLRLWPGIVIVALQWLLRFGVPAIEPDAVIIGVLAAFLGGLAVAVWWLFFSRARRAERWGALALTTAALAATPLVLHASVATGMQGIMFPLYAIPCVSLAFVSWAVVTRNVTGGARFGTLAATIVVASGAWGLVRTGGFTGDLDHDLAWRWSATPEERLLAESVGEPMAQPSAPSVPTADQGPAEWPGFRGLGRDGVVRGVRIDTDWTASPPTELWRRAVGPGWSSCAVRGNRVFTQEQRGEDEVVACYDLTTGEPIWRHRDPARFWESNAGAGPRGTPTWSDGRLYSLGATGILNALEAGDGEVVWSRNAADDTGAELPGWGFSSSPLVVGDLVVVGTAGALVAYDRASGEPRWSGPSSGGGYSSPQLFTLDGVEQILFTSEAGATSLSPGDGKLLWEHAWPGDPIVQPAITADGDILLSVDMGSGVRRIAPRKESSGWTVVERWTSIRLKPYYNDFVVHGGFAFGFDGGVLACIDLRTGKRQWKGGRYGRGQLILLADQGLLLVLSEQGEVALVEAAPEGFAEIARFQAIEGKTWNHPVLAGDVLLVRNAEEMAAFRLLLLGE